MPDGFPRQMHHLHTLQQCVMVPTSPHRCQHLLSVILIVAIVAAFRVVLIYISLISNDVEHIFMYLLIISIYSLEKSFVYISMALFLDITVLQETFTYSGCVFPVRYILKMFSPIM